jgi:endonuclease YncB( thermonuclease family)
MRQVLCVAVLAAAAVAPGPAAPDAERPRVERTLVRGEWRIPGDNLVRISGTVHVLDAHTLRFEDGTEVDLLGAMDAPDLEQAGAIDDKPYPAGREAAQFLRQSIGVRPVTCYIPTDRPDWASQTKFRQGEAFVDERSLNDELVRNGWAMAHHSGMAAWEAVARENRRGLWRGKFVFPQRWRKGERLPGEPPAPAGAGREAAAAPPSVAGTWEVTSRHATQGSLFQRVHTTRTRSATVRFEQDGDRITGHAVSTEYDDPEEPISFGEIRLAGDRLVFEYGIRGWRDGAGPIAVKERRLPNQGTLRADARLTGDRLVGHWSLLTADGSEAFRGEWEAVRVKAGKQ